MALKAPTTAAIAMKTARSMEEMIEFCVPHMVSAHPDLSPEQARAQMAQFFPMLMRWRKG